MPIDRDEMKKAMKEALKEWLDDKFIQFGKYSAAAAGCVILAAMAYLVLWANGWRHT